jgi:signal transduction histidine kinase
MRPVHEERASPRTPGIATGAIFVIGYYLATRLSEHGYGSLAVPSPFWLPDSVLLCALLLSPKSQWWFFAAIIWPIRLVTGAVPGTPIWFQLVTCANDTAKGLSAAWLLHRVVRRPIRLQTFREFMIFLGIAAVALPALSALAAAPARQLLGDPFWTSAYQWFLGDVLAQVIVTPTLVYWFTRSHRHNVRLLELICVLAALVGASFFGFLVSRPLNWPIALYLPIPFLIWAAVRLGPFGTANSLTLVAIVAVISAAGGTGVFAGVPPENAVLSIQLFLLVVAVALLSLATLTIERESLLVRELKLSSEVLDAQERERRRIARALHDDFGQRLAILKLDIEQVARNAEVSGSVRQQLDVLARTAAQMSRDIHSLSHALHPLTMDIVGIEGAIADLCREFSERDGLQVTCVCRDIPPRLEQDVSICIYRIAQEALQNVVKHSGATTATVELVGEKEQLTLCVSDDGSGFDVDSVSHQSGLGLVNMRDRLRALGGELAAEAAPDNGTLVRAVIPLRAAVDRRQLAGDVPTSALNARLNAASD